MPFVLAVDQPGPRPVPDGRGSEPVRPAGFEWTTDTELQSVLTDAGAVVGVVLELVRAGGWSIGIGAGPVPALPPSLLPDGARAATGTALLCARRAIDAARRRPVRLAVRGQDPVEAGDAQAVLTALAALVLRRSEQAWAAISLVTAGRTQAQAATALGISRQAVGQRLAAGQWDLETELRPTAARLLTRAE